MDLGDPQDENGFGSPEPKTRELPSDLPKSLNDRRRTPPLLTETEVYDGWQGGHINLHEACEDTGNVACSTGDPGATDWRISIASSSLDENRVLTMQLRSR